MINDFDAEKAKEYFENWYICRGFMLYAERNEKIATEALKAIRSGSECSACSCNCHNVADKALTSIKTGPHPEGDK